MDKPLNAALCPKRLITSLKIKIFLASVAAVGFLVAMIFIAILTQFDLANSESIEIEFEHKDVFLNGSLLLPKGEKPFPVALFIHGDGAQDRFAGDSYSLVMNAFLEKGIACFSWDKKGVGASGGNWLDQSMSERADEALAAMEALKNRNDIDSNKIGYIGFSQAGWVLPEIAIETNASAFYIIVGGAINWLKQSEYITRTRLLSEGFLDSEIQQVLSFSNRVNELILEGTAYDDYVSFHENNPAPRGYLENLMPEDRFQFVGKNIKSDIASSIGSINKPLLAIWGKDDLNVDAATSFSVYKEAIAKVKGRDATLLMYENATHGILNSKKYNYHRIDQWPISVKISYLLEGKEAYSKGYLDFLGNWVREKLD